MIASVPNVPKVTVSLDAGSLRNIVQHWGFFSRKDIAERAGHLLMLDIDFGRQCSLSCPTCFRRCNAVDDSGDADLTFEELLAVIDEGRRLGLREVKICGAGEPLENPDLLRLARHLTNLNIGLAIFSKGHVLGDDAVARRLFGHEGVTNGRILAQKLFELKTSILVSFQSFRHEMQDRLVGNISGYTIRRNRAIEILAEVGFNRCMPTRMALCSNPITKDNYPEIFDIYTYCRERNILPITAVLMTSGKQLRNNLLKEIDISDDEKLDLFVRLYRYNIEHGIQSFAEILADGISPMPGIHPCNQIAAGLYVTCNGTVTSCPGDCSPIGNVRQKSLTTIWSASANYQRRGMFNCWCPFKAGTTLPQAFCSLVLRNLTQCDVHSEIPRKLPSQSSSPFTLCARSSPLMSNSL